MSTDVSDVYAKHSTYEKSAQRHCTYFLNTPSDHKRAYRYFHEHNTYVVLFRAMVSINY
jgi:hypothetical protein